jgi:hypothetical protein
MGRTERVAPQALCGQAQSVTHPMNSGLLWQVFGASIRSSCPARARQLNGVMHEFLFAVFADISATIVDTSSAFCPFIDTR